MLKPKNKNTSETEAIIAALVRSVLSGFFLALSVISVAIAYISVPDKTSLVLQIPLFILGVYLYQTLKNFWVVHHMMKKG